MKEIAKNIKYIREELNLTQEYMASQLEMSQPAYSKIECAKTEVTFLQLVKISRLLFVDIFDLIKEHTNHVNIGELEARVKNLEDEIKDLRRTLKAILKEA